MQAALNIAIADHPPNKKLFLCTRQKLVMELYSTAHENTIQTWMMQREAQPLIAGHIKEHEKNQNYQANHEPQISPTTSWTIID